jgi:hypothetical protein
MGIDRLAFFRAECCGGAFSLGIGKQKGTSSATKARAGIDGGTGAFTSKCPLCRVRIGSDRWE